MEIVANLIQRVQSLYSRGVQSDDTDLSDRHIYHKLTTVRNRLTIQKYSKKQKISSWSYQVLPCIEMVKASIHDCPCLPPAGCDILKSRYPIPETITGFNGDIIRYVTSLDGSINYAETSWERMKHKKGSKYTSKNPEYFIKNGHLYIVHSSGFKTVVTLSGLFRDPLAATTFPSYCEKECEEGPDGSDCGGDCRSFLEREFPVDGDLVEPLVEIASEELVARFKQSIKDTENNKNDDVNGQ